MRQGVAPFALALLLSTVAQVQPVAAESFHWGEGVVHLTASSSAGAPVATERPGDTTWSVGTHETHAVIWHRGAEATVGSTLSVTGRLDSDAENTLGALGTATLNLNAPASATSTAFSATVTGEYRRTQTLFQVDLLGTAVDGNGEVVTVRVTGNGSWIPVNGYGDGVTTPIRAAEIRSNLTILFPGDIPPPPGPKAVSAAPFSGTASLPSFPCPPPMPDQMPCNGTFAGFADGVFVGDNASEIWAMQLSAPINAAFNYADLIQPGVPCAEGAANGVGSILANSDQVIGVWTDKVGVPKVIKAAELTFDFSWRRYGLTAVLTLSNISLRIHVQNPGGGWIQVIEPGSSAAPAVAGFAPAVTEAHLTACEFGTPGPAITADVAGVVSIDGF